MEVRVLVVLAATLVHWLISVLNTGIATVATDETLGMISQRHNFSKSPHQVILWFYLFLTPYLKKYSIKLYKIRGLLYNLDIISTTPYREILVMIILYIKNERLY